MARLEVSPKAVLGVQAARQTPRYAPVSRVRQIMKEAQIEEVEADVTAISSGSSVRRMFTPEKGDGAKMLEGSTEEVAGQIAALLQEKRS
jgi:electron transfer flavoprotein beta subunit